MSRSKRGNLDRIRMGIGFLAILVLVFSGYQIYTYMSEAQRSKAVTDALIDQACKPVQEQPLSGVDKSPDLEEHAPISIDFQLLQEENEEIAAWIYCEDTPINYPVMQGEDNQYYVKRLPDGTWNGAGTLFLDYRCEADFSDSISIVYGHSMKNNSMFGSLLKYEEQDYFEAHPTMFLLTPEGEYRIDLFAGYVTPADSEVYRLQFSREEQLAFIEEAKAQSDFQADVEVSEEDCLLVLSTCSRKVAGARYLVIGKMVEIS